MSKIFIIGMFKTGLASMKIALEKIRVRIQICLSLLCILLCGCVSNLCVIDAHCQASRLEKEGIKTRVATVVVNGCNHAIVIWYRREQGWFYDGSGSYKFWGQPEYEIPAWLSIIYNGKSRWLRWEER